MVPFNGVLILFYLLVYLNGWPVEYNATFNKGGGIVGICMKKSQLLEPFVALTIDFSTKTKDIIFGRRFTFPNAAEKVHIFVFAGLVVVVVAGIPLQMLFGILM